MSFAVVVLALAVLTLVALFNRARRAVDQARREDRLRSGWSLKNR